MERILRSSLWLLVLMLGSETLSAQMASSAIDTVVLQPGDAVQITVFRKEELSGEFTISAAGTVDHPLYQTVTVAGVPIAVARQRLNDFLKGWEAEPYFLVKPLFRVAVGGQVTKPDLYSLAPEMTVSQAVAAAGGVTTQGRPDRVRVLRRDQEFFLDLTRPGNDGMHMTVQSGDEILVERARSQILRDFISPAGTLLMAAVSLVSILVR